MNRLAELALSRIGCTPEILARANDASHPELSGTRAVCDRLARARRDRETVCVVPDFDMDGVAAGTIARAALSDMGLRVELFVPDPSEGYGVSERTIDEIAVRHPSTSVLLTCDTGIACGAAMERAASIGWCPIVTDHHVARTPPAACGDLVVDPCLEGDPYPHGSICGAHVIWQVMASLAETLGDGPARSRLELLRAFAGIGTVSDSMDMLFENRALVTDSIDICRLLMRADGLVDRLGGSPEYSRALTGLAGMLAKLVESGRISGPDDVGCELFGFYIAPMINACKRMEGDMRCAFDMFGGGDVDACFGYLSEMNDRRRAIVADLMDRVSKQDNPWWPHVVIIDAMPGARGLIASSICSATGEPCVALSPVADGLSGSGRSPAWLDLRSVALRAGAFAAGHACAMGVRLGAGLAPDVLARAISDAADAARPTGEPARPALLVADDGSGDVAPDAEALLGYLEAIESVGPFGPGFPEPPVGVELDPARVAWRRFGSESAHLRGSAAGGLSLVAFNVDPDRERAITGSGRVSLSGRLRLNRYRGQRSAQFIIDGATPCARR